MGLVLDLGTWVFPISAATGQPSKFTSNAYPCQSKASRFRRISCYYPPPSFPSQRESRPPFPQLLSLAPQREPQPPPTPVILAPAGIHPPSPSFPPQLEPGPPTTPRHPRRSGDPEPLLCANTVVLTETRPARSSLRALCVKPHPHAIRPLTPPNAPPHHRTNVL